VTVGNPALVFIFPEACAVDVGLFIYNKQMI